MDQILINSLEVYVIVGVHDWERTNRQLVLLDIKISYDCQLAGKSDQLTDALNYQDVCETLTQEIEKTEFKLIEALAEFCAKLILEKFPVKKVKITLHKPDAIKNTQSIAVRITRSKLP